MTRPRIRLKSQSTRNKPWPKGRARTWRVDPDVGRWLDERCTIGPSLGASACRLARSWRSWCVGRSLEPGDKDHLGRQLTLRGFPTLRTRTGIRRCGLTVTPSA
jgi:hypothetical protein